mmetsp:Transcript_8052/g.16443  ORF Transcript_8052/g.16443 Transcript_8052/m.16443 type:complete len:88 (-) Transcript_8052:748-1011(-)
MREYYLCITPMIEIVFILAQARCGVKELVSLFYREKGRHAAATTSSIQNNAADTEAIDPMPDLQLFSLSSNNELLQYIDPKRVSVVN